MSKIIRTKIVYDVYPDENGLLDWEDEDSTPRTEEELIQFAREEMYELIMNGCKHDDIWNMIDVEIVGG